MSRWFLALCPLEAKQEANEHLGSCADPPFFFKWCDLQHCSEFVTYASYISHYFNI
jgi:hypothetical protein